MQTSQTDANELDTGTTVVGVVAEGKGEADADDEDGPAVVLATDRRASLGRMVSSKSVQKVQEIADGAAMAYSGSVSGADALTKSLQTQVTLYETRRSKAMSPTALGTLVGNALRENQFGVQPVVAAVADDARLFSYDGAGGRTEAEYVAVGSGTPYAYGHLEDAYEPGLSVDEATDLAEAAVAVATERDTASGNGLCLAIVRDDGVEIDVAETTIGA